MTLFKFTSKHVGPLFVLQTLSHYGFFLAFVVLVSYNENPAVRNAGAKVVKQLTPLHALYGFVIVYGFLKQSKCSEKNPYPLCFVMGDVLFFVSYVACARFSKKDLDACFPKELNEKEADEKSTAMLQFDTYFGCFKKMALWHLVELVLGKLLFKTVFKGALLCSSDGLEWHYRSGLAHLFLVLHILGTVQALGMHRSVFIKSAKSMGLIAKTAKDVKKEEKAAEKAEKKEAKKNK